MKKFLSLVLILSLVLALGGTFTSCSSPNNEEQAALIDFGKKYMFDEDRYYVFDADNTGYYEEYLKYDDEYDAKRSYVMSGRIDFEWRIASDGNVYLFKTDVEYYDDHKPSDEIPADISLIDEPLTFADEFFAYTSHSQLGSQTHRCVKEGSDLAKAVN